MKKGDRIFRLRRGNIDISLPQGPIQSSIELQSVVNENVEERIQSVVESEYEIPL